MNLSERVSGCVQATNKTMSDYDQRSALGIARSALDTGNLNVWHPTKSKDMMEYPRRDQLAKDLHELIAGIDREDAIEALAHARSVVNAPFVNPTMLGWQAARAKYGVVGSKKKGEKQAGKE